MIEFDREAESAIAVKPSAVFFELSVVFSDSSRTLRSVLTCSLNCALLARSAACCRAAASWPMVSPVRPGPCSVSCTGSGLPLRSRPRLRSASATASSCIALVARSTAIVSALKILVPSAVSCRLASAARRCTFCWNASCSSAAVSVLIARVSARIAMMFGWRSALTACSTCSSAALVSFSLFCERTSEL